MRNYWWFSLLGWLGLVFSALEMGWLNNTTTLAQEGKKLPVRPLAFAPTDPTIGFKIGGLSKVEICTNAAAVKDLVGAEAAQSLVRTVDFAKEKIVLVSWTTSGPPEGKLRYEVKDAGKKGLVNFYIQGPGGFARGQRARIGFDFFAVPRDLAVTFDPKER